MAIISMEKFREGQQGKKRERGKGGSNWEENIQKFLNHCVAKNLRESTIDYYEKNLKNYLLRDFLPSANIKNVEDFDISDVDQFVVFWKNKGLKTTTINIRLRALRAFFYFLKEYKFSKNEVKIKMIKEDVKKIQTFTEKEVKKIIEKAKGEVTFACFRDWAMANFLIGTGVRMNTLRNIMVEDVNFSESTITFRHTKNREDQIFPMSLSLMQVLREYMDVREGEGDDILFCNVYGGQMGKKTINSRLKKYCREKLGGENGMRYSTHDFRHTFAVMYIRNSGGDILTLQKLLGHKSLEITRKYANMLFGDVQRQFGRFSPLDNLAAAKKSGRKAIKMSKER